MPLSVFNRLQLGETNPTTVMLQLVDKSLAHPWGVIEDVLMKVDKFIPRRFYSTGHERGHECPNYYWEAVLGNRPSTNRCPEGRAETESLRRRSGL